MTPASSSSRIEQEQQEIRAAARRLLDGNVLRSNGKLTVATLAVESGLPRHRLYEHHSTLVDEFKTAAGGGPIPPDVQALRQQLADANERIALLEEGNKHLQERIKTLSAVVTELTQETQANNIVTMPRRRKPNVN